ncbi:AraC family transcriptional regulator [Kibdelosporangium philippinense]|uniref:AraC family transcriptional regulator n=1 Tax=Kibdelosporangium philippinense TaxID=211113 RepID=A0ABS8Z460_9PSEU|nr:AraC family transcriptional regulator [Kibdelosporangium philippinense]MCE7001570.1 AraC family transcriptional regulator [Kibdelosporangium philippinense]
MDTVSRLIGLARLAASVDKRCLLGRTTVMDVPDAGDGEAWFHVLLDGECTVDLPSGQLALKAGEALVVPNGERHRVRTNGPGRLHGTVETAGESYDTIRSSHTEDDVIDLFCGRYTYGSGAGAILFRTLPDPLHVNLSTSDSVAMLTTIMRREARESGAGTAVILGALSSALLAMMLRQSDHSVPLWTAVDDPRIRTAIDEVVTAPGEDWPIARLSETASMSRATFIRHFTRTTGMTVGAFLTHVRLMTAAELLSTTDLTVATVAGRVGYKSESAFSRAFRESTGQTPAKFRRSTGSHVVEPHL